MNWLYSCRKVSELLSQDMDSPLGVIDRIRLRIHVSMCRNCANVEQQVLGVRALTRTLFASTLAPDIDDSSPL